MKVGFIQLPVFIFFFMLSVAGCGGGENADDNDNGEESVNFDVSAVPDISGEWEFLGTICTSSISVSDPMVIDQDGIDLTIYDIDGIPMSGKFTSLEEFRMEPPDTIDYSGLSITGELEEDGRMFITFVANGICYITYARPGWNSGDEIEDGEEDVCTSFAVTPADVVVGLGGQVSFSAENGTPPYTWSVDSEIGSTIDDSGQYTAGSEMSLDTVSVTDSNNCEASAYVEVSEE